MAFVYFMYGNFLLFLKYFLNAHRMFKVFLDVKAFELNMSHSYNPLLGAISHINATCLVP